MDYSGIFEGVVALIDSGSKNRVYVRVLGVHSQETPVNALPKASICQPPGCFFRYSEGNHVYIQFVGGDLERPVIIGRVVTELGGIPDVPISQGLDSSPEIWEIEDDSGNTIRLDARLSQQSIKIVSPGATITLSATSKGIRLDATGSVEVTGANVSVNAASANVAAQTINIHADGSNLLGGDAGSVNIAGNGEVNINAPPTIPSPTMETAGSGKINIGQNNPRINGIGLPPPVGIPQQANVLNARSRFINIGVGPTGFNGDTVGTANDALLSPNIDFEPTLADSAVSAAPPTPLPLLPTLQVNIRSSVQVAIAAPRVVIGGSVSTQIFAQNACSIFSYGTADITALKSVSLTAIEDVSLTASKSVTVTGPTVDFTVLGNMSSTVIGKASIAASVVDVSATGALSISAGSAASISAPILTLSGVIKLDGLLLINSIPYSAHAHISTAPSNPTTPPII